jgi:hypothetical protein
MAKPEQTYCGARTAANNYWRDANNVPLQQATKSR